MFDTIVWASDGSPNADHALEVAKLLARDHEASLVVVHVAQHYATKSGLAVYPDEEFVKTRLEQKVAELAEEGFNPQLKVIDHVGPHAAHDIADAARNAGADVIVMGTRGHSPIPGLLLGGVVQRLLHVAPCPVMVVPPAS